MPNSKKQDKYVLVVEDDDGVRAMLKMALKQNGLIAKLAPTGKRAIEILKHYFHAIGVVLLDVQMPGMHGPTTLVALKEIKPDIRCCSGEASRAG